MDNFFSLQTLACVLIGYLLGSIPFALVIGKVFYHTDVRQYGSGNLGGTNTGRVLGAKAGAAVIACDILKVVAAIALASLIFAGFKGGKAVATMFGFLLATSIFTFQNAWYLIIPRAAFLLLLVLFKMVSLASMAAALCSSIFISVMQMDQLQIMIASWLMTILVIYRHRSNIVKIKNGQENKVSWL